LSNTYQLLISAPEGGSCDNFKDMIIHTMSKFENKKGTIDDILSQMIHGFGKDKVCEQTNQTILSFDEQDNPAAIKNVK
jgi:hypothetical protein